ncbi:3-oxoacyl-ACP synthase [Streptococcus pneumoniae]|uniref:beta-ketoacyl-[acyl-carrier-protein] synthase family protein n=1 Tax=Streptococcus pneumoniae TaxID=1313 RepID=UPI0005E56B4B|nr:beta-ketoacyl-[acyl-carrier-protein] synthase family protein [Streptococcus pneumoniae]CKI33230.1 3-oxoacyl-ACP synthase [Streptococcus pneumoniae]CKI33541.1 3-oxoacyl-ACP synthase [Streptococcus pneumoniae]VIU60663.1 3-oxoacyl-ACP synthase [Streptococcus pneumoniae]VIU79625.1 3-oxoacyl-ACP synthase [Streptococcus pneumoniae]VIV40340.1 3-oxoacyl-ACP synthase [Streptococcus pneumoniae]
MKNKVVITGMGIESSIGSDIEEFWKNCLNGCIGTSLIEKDKLEIVNSNQGGQIKTFKSDLNTYGRSCKLLISAITEVLMDSGLDSQSLDSVFIGTTMGETTIDYTLPNSHSKRKNSKNLLRQNQLDNLICDALNELEINDVEVNLFCNACSGGNYALIAGFEGVRNGRINAVIIGGVDSFSTLAYYGFSRLNAIASDVCKPFDKNRDGMLVAEGVGCLLLESEEHALSRNAKIYAEVVGYGMSSDAYHINAPHPEGRGIECATQKALKYAGVNPNQVDYISAHGTGTVANDKIESKILGNIFGEKTPVSSVKSMLGHTMGAASAIESIVCCLAIRDSKIPPTVNHITEDSDCNINCVPNYYQNKEITYAMNNSYAFAGSNASVIFKKYSGG